MKKRIVALLSVAALAVGMFSTTASAADMDSWSVSYSKGAPTTVANPVDYAYVDYGNLGFTGYCNRLSGGKVIITTGHGAGIVGNNVTFESSGKKPFKLVNKVNGTVKFKIELKPSGINANASGNIKKN